MRCQGCGHKIHPDELDKTLYKNQKEGTLSVKWKCAACGLNKKAKWTVVALQSCMQHMLVPETIYRYIVHKYFLTDAMDASEQIRLEKLAPITANELNDLHRLMEKENILASLPRA